jgi:hypothetical protein
MSHNQQVKVVGTNGQLSLGKEFAGQMVLIDQIGEGTWVIKTGTFIPDSEKWLHEGKYGAKLDKALAWAEKTKPSDNFDRFEQGSKKK